MHTTKLFIGFGLFLLGYLPFENSVQLSSLISKNNYTVVQTKNLAPGKEIYVDFCIQCHGADGKGTDKKIPPLAGSDWLTKKRTQSIHSVKFGQSGEIVVNKMKFNNTMPPMGLSNKEVADVMNYIMNSWGNKQHKTVTEKEVEKIQK